MARANVSALLPPPPPPPPIRESKNLIRRGSLLRAIRARPMHCLHPSLQTTRVRPAADAADLLSTCLYYSFLLSFNKGEPRHRTINLT